MDFCDTIDLEVKMLETEDWGDGPERHSLFRIQTPEEVLEEAIQKYNISVD